MSPSRVLDDTSHDGAEDEHEQAPPAASGEGVEEPDAPQGAGRVGPSSDLPPVTRLEPAPRRVTVCRARVAAAGR